MKTFYGGTYIGKEVLEENKIYHPIRLEYYKIEETKDNKSYYGIEVVETEYKEEQLEVKRDCIKNVTSDEEQILELLEKFKAGTVMPGFVKETIQENGTKETIKF